jgi:biotin operon repressor
MEETETKIIKWGIEITDKCPGYYINEKVANCPDLSANEQRCMALLNCMSNRRGYTYTEKEQLAHWLGLSPATVGSMLRKLRKNGFVMGYRPHKLYVSPEWRDLNREERAEWRLYLQC